MDKKKTGKRKQAKAVQHRKKVMLITVLAAVIIIAAAVVTMFLLNGDSYESDVNTVYLLEDGRVISNSVENFDENLYSKEDLKAYIKENTDTYNNVENEILVKQKSLKVKNGVATLVMEYANADVFEDFEGTGFFTGTVADALRAGYTFDGSFVNLTDGKQELCTSEEFLTGDYKVVITKTDVAVSIEEGEICYVTSERTESVKDGMVVVKDGANLLDESLALESEENTEGVENTESDEIIMDDELLLGEEEGVVFDFGEEESTEYSYDDIYTYIIYK